MPIDFEKIAEDLNGITDLRNALKTSTRCVTSKEDKALHKCREAHTAVHRAISSLENSKEVDSVEKSRRQILISSQALIQALMELETL